MTTERVAGYVRVSTDEQAEKGLSLDNQKDRIQDFCRAKGWELVELFEDSGYSGKTIDRPAMARLIAGAKRGDFNIVVVYKLDRLTRKVRDLGYLLEDIFENHGLGFTSVVDNFDTTTAGGKLIMNVLGSVAQWERDVISERTRDALRYKQKKGENVGSPPLGYAAIDKNLVPVDEELEVVNLVFRMRGKRKRKATLRAIAEELNARGYKTKRGGRFYASTVRYILENQRYAVTQAA